MKQLNVGDIISFGSKLEYSSTDIPGIVMLHGVAINGKEQSVPIISNYAAYTNYLNNRFK